MSAETFEKLWRRSQARNREAELNRRFLHSVIREKIGKEAWDDICKEYNKRLQAMRREGERL